jgi:hypothetical protein
MLKKCKNKNIRRLLLSIKTFREQKQEKTMKKRHHKENQTKSDNKGLKVRIKNL